MSAELLEALHEAAGTNDPEAVRAFLSYHRELARRCHVAEVALDRTLKENTDLVRALAVLRPLTFHERLALNGWLHALLRRVIAWGLAENADSIRASVRDAQGLVAQLLGGSDEYTEAARDVRYELAHGDLRHLNGTPEKEGV